MYDVNSTNWIAGTRYFTQVTNNDHSAWLYIVTLLSLCYIIIVFAVRFVVKYGMYGRDDWALLASTILAVGQHFASLAGLGKGMGKSASLLSSAQRASAQRVRNPSGTTSSPLPLTAMSSIPPPMHSSSPSRIAPRSFPARSSPSDCSRTVDDATFTCAGAWWEPRFASGCGRSCHSPLIVPSRPSL